MSEMSRKRSDKPVPIAHQTVAANVCDTKTEKILKITFRRLPGFLVVASGWGCSGYVT